MISTGIAGLDNLLGGGIAPGLVTDIFGPAGSGKTQLALQICANAIGKKIIYQDTTGSFRPERMLQIMRARGIPEGFLENMIVARVTNTAEQARGLDRIREVGPGLLVVDNVSDLFSFEYSRESSSLARHVMFMEYMHSLSMCCIKNRIPAVITNVVRRYGEQERENLERSVSMFTHRKVRLSRQGARVIAEVLPSFGGRREVSYEITEGGLVGAG